MATSTTTASRRPRAQPDERADRDHRQEHVPQQLVATSPTRSRRSRRVIVSSTSDGTTVPRRVSIFCSIACATVDGVGALALGDRNGHRRVPCPTCSSGRGRTPSGSPSLSRTVATSRTSTVRPRAEGHDDVADVVHVAQARAGLHAHVCPPEIGPVDVRCWLVAASAFFTWRGSTPYADNWAGFRSTRIWRGRPPMIVTSETSGTSVIASSICVARRRSWWSS